MIKVLNIAGNLKTGGVSTIIKSLINLNAAADSNYDLLLFNDEVTRELPKCRVYNLTGKINNPISAIKEIRKIAKYYDAYLIHAPEIKIMPLLISTRKKCLVFQHGMALSKKSFIKRVTKRILLNILPLFDNVKVICSSKQAAIKMRSYGILVPASKIEIINFGIQTRNIVSAKMMTPDKIIIGTAGILSKIKRFDILIRSLYDYSGITKLVVKIAGDGPELNYLKELASQIKNPAVEVIFEGNIENMEQFYTGLDLFVFPSHNESFGLVVAEALSYRIPVVCFSDLGGALNLVKNEINGIIVEDKTTGLTDLFNKIAEYPNFILELRKNIKPEDLEMYDIRQTRNQLDKMIGI